MKFLSKLREEDPSSAAAYHLEGLLEAQDNIRSLLAKLDKGSALDPEGTAETLTYLQVEIYSHLAYHMKELRRPLKRLIDAAYKDLPDIEEEGRLEWLEQITSRRQAELEAERVKRASTSPASKSTRRRSGA
jgi:hypothetical protein